MTTTTANGAGAAGGAVDEAVQTVIAAVEHPPVTPGADANVSAAFALGWQIAQLYRPGPTAPTPAAPDDLPGFGRLDSAERAQISLGQIKVALVKLDPAVLAAGLPAPETQAVSDCFADGIDDATRRDRIRALHLELLSVLTAADFRLGKAYSLGRSLADTCRKPDTWDLLLAELDPDHVLSLRAPLEDLATAFPPHAAHSVLESLDWWAGFVHRPDDQRGGEDPADALQAIGRQGEIWRSLLSGEKAGPDMLEITHYLDAAGRLLITTRGLIRHFIRHFPLIVAMIAILFLGGVALILDPQTSASILAGAGGILASLGLTWKAVGATVGGLGAKLEQQVWQAELDHAIADAITLLPPAARGPAAPARSRGRPRVGPGVRG